MEAMRGWRSIPAECSNRRGGGQGSGKLRRDVGGCATSLRSQAWSKGGGGGGGAECLRRGKGRGRDRGGYISARCHNPEVDEEGKGLAMSGRRRGGGVSASGTSSSSSSVRVVVDGDQDAIPTTSTRKVYGVEAAASEAMVGGRGNGAKRENGDRGRCSANGLISNNGGGVPPPVHEEEEGKGKLGLVSPQRPRWKLWLAAVKPPIYSVALVPLLVGAAAAFGTHSIIFRERLSLLCTGSLLVIAWLNLSNDGYDAEMGADVNKPESVVALTRGNKKGVLRLAWLSLTLGVGFIAAALREAPAGLPAALLLAAAIACGWAYQCPPYRLSYRGWGEALTFTAFGPCATTAFYLAFAGGEVLWKTCCAAAVLVGLTTASILATSHFHQEEEDRNAGKLSPVVRFGRKAVAGFLKTGVIYFYAIATLAVALGALPFEYIISMLLSIPSAVSLVRFVRRNYDDDEAIRTAKFRATQWHVMHGLSLILGLSIIIV